MRILKWVTVEQEVQVDVSVEDITAAIYETNDFLSCLNSIAGGLKAVKDDMIAKMSDGQCDVVREFLTAQASRYTR